jgi:hypothetical protein
MASSADAPLRVLKVSETMPVSREIDKIHRFITWIEKNLAQLQVD